jgi:eukaryotic-like serine/threonine-protein kinase
LYLSVLTDGFHVWRQHFPDGKPEQLTSGPTLQEGIAMAPDGKSLITSVGSRDSTVWLHDKSGDQQISSEGTGTAPSFSSDGKSLYFLMANGQTAGFELWVKDVASGKIEGLLPGISMDGYSVSQDGKEVTFEADDENGHPSLWIASTNRRSSPVRISSSAIEDSPYFLPDGDIVFRALEGKSNFLYRMKKDGTGRHKITAERILDPVAISPNGRWLIASSAGPDQEHSAVTKAFAVDGSATVQLCSGYCLVKWDTSGKFLYLYFPALFEGTYALPVAHDSEFPRLPPGGIMRKEDVTSLKYAVAIPSGVNSAVSPSVYAYTRQNTHRNLYRIPLQ